MKIFLLEPPLMDAATTAKTRIIYKGLKRLGHEVVEHPSDSTLFVNLRKDEPDVVFNLSSTYAWDKTNLIPALLEIAGVCYTGSGILGLSLARNYTKLFPMLLNSGIRVPFFIVASGSSNSKIKIPFPLTLLRDNQPDNLSLNNMVDLDRALNLAPLDEDVLFLEKIAGKRVGLFLLDHLPVFPGIDQPYLAIAQKAYDVFEARGLVRFDFIQSAEPILERIEIAPDPLDEKLVRTAELAGWDEDYILESLVQHAGRDHSMALGCASPYKPIGLEP